MSNIYLYICRSYTVMKVILRGIEKNVLHIQPHTPSASEKQIEILMAQERASSRPSAQKRDLASCRLELWLKRTFGKIEIPKR